MLRSDRLALLAAGPTAASRLHAASCEALPPVERSSSRGALEAARPAAGAAGSDHRPRLSCALCPIAPNAAGAGGCRPLSVVSFVSRCPDPGPLPLPATAARGLALLDPVRHPERDRGGDVDRGVGADNNADHEDEGEGVDDVAAEDEEREDDGPRQAGGDD